ncbi:hypothetical protein [uncultured Jatrophihabitans sp.]|uniref:WXG100-like domain-containing protein n=1 Tax=uncultured Jatrophihabitans sp. TaxID=1610747 RepID=UPI0035CA6A69
MTTFLDVETADFVQAAQSMAHDVGDPAGNALLRLQFGLGDCAQMAGRDPGGAAWAASYDRAAAAALTAATDVVDATYRVGAMFAQTARNYAAADAASGGHPAHVDAAPVPRHNAAPCLSPPSATGGSGGAPTGWSLVENTVGRVWPDGHQDRLHAAAVAWSRAASTLRDTASWTVLSDVAFDRDRLPEADDMNVVCMSVTSHINAVAGVFDQLADSCRELAQHIDVAHSEVEHELASLAGQSAAIEVGGAVCCPSSLRARPSWWRKGSRPGGSPLSRIASAI